MFLLNEYPLIQFVKSETIKKNLFTDFQAFVCYENKFFSSSLCEWDIVKQNFSSSLREWDIVKQNFSSSLREWDIVKQNFSTSLREGVLLNETFV